jgi:hypothetical protein
MAGGAPMIAAAGLRLHAEADREGGLEGGPSGPADPGVHAVGDRRRFGWAVRWERASLRLSHLDGKEIGLPPWAYAGPRPREGGL